MELTLRSRRTLLAGPMGLGTPVAIRSNAQKGRARVALTIAAAASMALSMGVSASVPSAAATSDVSAAGANTPSNVPYSLPVNLPATVASPASDALAPYTPLVLTLIHQLEPDNPPTAAELTNASLLLHGAGFGGSAVPSCHNVGPGFAPKGTTPSIMPICWTDAQGVNVLSGPNVHNTTAPMTLLGLGATFNSIVGNVWGQTEGKESRLLMVNGLYGPQTDLDRLPNWGRNLTTTGEDPYLSSQLVAAQINGIQGAGTMSQMKHFVVYNGQASNANTTIQDQSLHQQYLTPYEAGFTSGNAAATMCSYQIWQDTSGNLPATVSALSTSAPLSPFASGPTPQTWPLDQAHYSCEQPLSLDYVLRNMWGSQAFVGTDFGAAHSSNAILQGQDAEFPSSNFFDATDPTSTRAAVDATGNTCANASGAAEPCTTPGALHVGGIPGPGCPMVAAGGTVVGGGCSIVNAVLNGTLPLSVFNQALARILYQEQRFGMLGCSDTPVSALCTNPGGVGADQTGTAPLPTGPASGATPARNLGTKNGDAAVSERISEEGGVLLKNDGKALPISQSDLSGGVLVTGPGAEYTIADPTSESSIGFLDRDRINPLQQLQAFSGKPGAFSYVPANAPSGQAVPAAALSDSNASVTGHLHRTTGPGSPTTDSTIDFTAVSGHGQLTPGGYTWTGYVYVPVTDTYIFRFQQSSAVPSGNVGFSLDGTPRTLTTASPVYGSAGGFGGNTAVQGSPTNAGYTEPGLTNSQFIAGTLSGGTFHAVTITFNNSTAGPASFRFADSRVNGDIADAAAAAAGKKLAIVFLNDNGAATEFGQGALSNIPNPYGSNPPNISAVASLPSEDTQLVNAVAAVNPNTVVVLNTQNPVLMPWIANVKSVLEMWFSGQEGGTSTARLLLGLANPSGHLPITFPASATDTIWGYNQTTPLYAGDTVGPHLERLNGNGGCLGAGCPASTTTNESEGIYSGYRFFDKQGITPLFPFGYGLSYTQFGFSDLAVRPASDGGVDVTFRVKNTGSVTGAEVPQVYVGPPTDRPAGVQFPVRALAQFAKVTLEAGESKVERLHVTARDLSYWSPTTQKWILDLRGRTVYVGDGDMMSRLPLHTTLAAPKDPADSTSCINQQLNASTIIGNLTVPEGAWCDLVDVTVTGNLTLDSVTGVRVVDSIIGGDFVARDTQRAADPRSSGANVVCGSTIGGDLRITDSQRLARWNIGSCGANSVRGSVKLDDSQSRYEAVKT